MSHDCPVPLCEVTHDSMDLLVDHLSDDHDIYGKLTRGDLELHQPASRRAVADGGERR